MLRSDRGPRVRRRTTRWLPGPPRTVTRCAPGPQPLHDLCLRHTTLALFNLLPTTIELRNVLWRDACRVRIEGRKLGDEIRDRQPELRGARAQPVSRAFV